MTRIGILSDTHGLLDKRIFEHFKDVDEIWHAGDIGSEEVLRKLREFKPTRAVFGNMDSGDVRYSLDEFYRFRVEDVNVLMTHIGGYPGRYDPSIRAQLQGRPPKLFIAGHSHILKVLYDKKLDCLHMNPGAAGKYGFHRVRTLLRFLLDEGDIRDLEVIEIGKQG